MFENDVTRPEHSSCDARMFTRGFVWVSGVNVGHLITVLFDRSEGSSVRQKGFVVVVVRCKSASALGDRWGLCGSSLMRVTSMHDIKS